MSYTVTVVSAEPGVALPTTDLYVVGRSVVLSDAEYRVLDPDYVAKHLTITASAPGTAVDFPSTRSGASPASATVFNVKDYGATGDGTTDDTASIQAAANAAVATKGIVYLPPGSFKVTSMISLGSGVSLHGSGMQASRFKATAIVGTPVIAGPGNNKGATFKDFGIDGRQAGASGPVGNANAAYGLNVQYGLWLGVYAVQCLVESVDVDGTAVGFGIAYGGGVTLLNCHAQNCRDAGAWIAGNNSDTHRILGGLFQVTNPSGGASASELVANIKITDDGNTAHIPQNVLVDGVTIDEIGGNSSGGGANIYIQALDVTLSNAILYAPGKKQSGGGNYYGVHIASTSKRVKVKNTRIQPFVVDNIRVPNQTIQIDAGATDCVLEDITTDPNAANGGGDINDLGTGTVYRNVNGFTSVGVTSAVNPLTGMYHITQFGAKCDARTVTDLVTTNTSAVVTSATAAFTATDVGKMVSLITTGAGSRKTTTILSVQSATQATLATTVTATGTGGHATIATDDTAAVQATVAAAVAGGTVWIPGQTGISGTITGTRSVNFAGAGCNPVWSTVVASGGTQIPGASPWLTGSVLIQFAAATDVFTLSATGITSHIRGLGIRFAEAIAFFNTGHGINGFPTATSSSGHENGPVSCTWDSVKVFGHDGNHYAFRLLNSNMLHGFGLESYGGGGFYMECDSYTSSYGNGEVSGTYFAVIAGGTANGFHLKSRTTGFPGSLNLLTFLRPQANIFTVSGTIATMYAPTAPTVAQYLWRDEGDPSNVLVVAPDLEHTSGVYFPTVFGAGTIVHAGGGTVNNTTGNIPPAYLTKKARPGTPTITAGNGAGVGNGASVSIQQVYGTAGAPGYNDERGQVNVTTGTSVFGADGGAVCTVILQANVRIGAVHITPTYPPVSTDAKFYVKNIAFDRFEVWSHAGLATSTTYSFLYTVVE